MKYSKIYLLFIIMFITSCKGTDGVESVYNYEISNKTDTTIIISFKRKGLNNTNNKVFNIKTGESIVAFTGSGIDGSLPSVYDSSFVYYKNKVLVDTLTHVKNSLLNTSSYIEQSKTTVKKITSHVYLLTIDQNFLDTSLK